MKNKFLLIPLLSVSLFGGAVDGVTSLASAATTTDGTPTAISGGTFDPHRGRHVG